MVGCGQGESAEFLVRHYQATVHGVDRCPARVFKAIERQVKLDADLRQKVRLRWCKGKNDEIDRYIDR